MHHLIHPTPSTLGRVFTALVFLMQITSVHALDNQDSYLRRFVGEWKGEYTVTNWYGETIASHPIEQSLYWMDGHLLGATAIQLSNDEIKYEYSEVWYDGTTLISIVENEEKKVKYYGWFTHYTMWWQSDYDSNTNFHMLQKEKLEPTPDGFRLVVEGYKWTASARAFNVHFITAKLLRLKANEEFKLIGTLPK